MKLLGIEQTKKDKDHEGVKGQQISSWEAKME